MTESGLRFAASLVCVLWLGAVAKGQRTVRVTDFGAAVDGKTLCTGAIQQAIDTCAGLDGGTVSFPPGTYLSGSLVLKSNVTLSLGKGATLLGSPNREDYYGQPHDAEGEPVEGEPVFRNLIHGEGLHDVAICGPGTIDGSGAAFRDKTKKRTKAIYLLNCRDVLVEDVRLRSAGSWMQHYRFCENLTIRNIDVFNHIAYNNDGLNVDSCRNVTITGCRVDSDDDGIVLKSLSDRPCQDVVIEGCTISSHCNALKLGTESGGGFVNIRISDCTVFSPRQSERTYGRQRGLAGVALEVVDGGRLENVTVANVSIEGVSVPLFLRLGNRARSYSGGPKPEVGTFRKVRLSNITATGTSVIGCSITGLPGRPIQDVVLENVDLGFEGGGTLEDTRREVPEREASYPESTMFGTLPAYGFYCRHARGIKFVGLKLQTDQPDLRHAMVFDDVEGLEINGLEATFSPGAAAMLRMVQVRQATVRALAPTTLVDTLLSLGGDQTREILLQNCELHGVREVAVQSSEVPEGALLQEGQE